MGTSLRQRSNVMPDGFGDGRRIKQEIVGTFDFAELGGAVGDIGLGVSLPANALITGGYCEVLTTFSSPTTDDATVGIEAGTADLIAAVAIDDGGTPWTAGIKAIIPVQTAATAIKVGTAAVELIVDIGVEDITVGRFIVVVEYTITGVA